MKKSFGFMFVLVLSVVVVAGCSSSGGTDSNTSETQSNESHESQTHAKKDKTQSDTLPLLTIMVNLEQEMQAISSGLWRHNFEQIRTAAKGIANHAKIPKNQIKTIRGILGEEQFKKFVKDDKTVHNMAVQLGEAASEEDFGRTAEIYQQLEQGCISCHQKHRTEIREHPDW